MLDFGRLVEYLKDETDNLAAFECVTKPEL